ncbi:hypothetical protein WR25_01125 [Diploscapter pachys]|uniref:MADF domain-containing protein n=1 Tax=Diploscapter pachys TaxID=2018661 RepID=A0A2A2KUT6_9BILA|nr:hypothetical protein WR25_01125 [Diploscapter pachys]
MKGITVDKVKTNKKPTKRWSRPANEIHPPLTTMPLSHSSTPCQDYLTMSKRKSEAVAPVTDIASLKGQELPEWNDMLRGILVALIKERRALWDSRFRTVKYRMIMLLQEVANVLANQNKNINEWAVLEKWCWMCEMYARACSGETEWPWRYKGAMGFLAEFAGCGSQYLDCIPKERFIALTELYAQESEEKKFSKMPVIKKKREPLFVSEMALYAQVFPLPGEDAVRENTTTVKEAIISGMAEGRRRGRPGRPRKSNMNAESPQRGEVHDSAPSAASATSTGHVTSSSSSLTVVPIQDTADVKPSLLPERNFPSHYFLFIKKVKHIKIGKTNSSGAAASSSPASNASNLGLSHGNSTKDPKVEERVRAVLALTSNVTDVEWSHKAILTLIDAMKARPALWHTKHPHYSSAAVRQQLLLDTLLTINRLPGCDKVTGDKMWNKWSDLRQIYEEIEKLMWKGEYVKWRYRQNLAFLSPQVMDACRFDDVPSTSIATSVNAQTTLADLFAATSNDTTTSETDPNSHLQKVIGLINDTGLISTIAAPSPPVKRTRFTRRSSTRQEVQNAAQMSANAAGGKASL